MNEATVRKFLADSNLSDAAKERLSEGIARAEGDANELQKIHDHIKVTAGGATKSYSTKKQSSWDSR